MLEILNRLPAHTYQELDNFLSFIGIYEDRRRTRALRALIQAQKCRIAGKRGVEAGAGLGVVTQLLLDAGASKVYAVERNPLCVRFLRERFLGNKKVEVIDEPIERFSPPRGTVDFVFHELYGPLLLDESILALERIRFDPGYVLPDSGVLLAESVPLKALCDPTIDVRMLRLMGGALVTDLFPGFRFRSPRIAGVWHFARGVRKYRFTWSLVRRHEVLALGMQVWHDGVRVIGTQDCDNWPYVFAHSRCQNFSLRFEYSRGMTDVRFGQR